jgi:hypothetical protein
MPPSEKNLGLEGRTAYAPFVRRVMIPNPNDQMSPTARRRRAKIGARARWHRYHRGELERFTHIYTEAIKSHAQLVAHIERLDLPVAPEMVRLAHRLLAEFANVWELARAPGWDNMHWRTYAVPGVQDGPAQPTGENEG